MSDTDRGQVSASAAEVYDAFFVPALFEQWTDVLLDVADVRPGHRVLDVGCGTGVLARAAHARVGAHGHVAGLDPNDGMLPSPTGPNQTSSGSSGLPNRRRTPSTRSTGPSASSPSCSSPIPRARSPR